MKTRSSSSSTTAAVFAREALLRPLSFMAIAAARAWKRNLLERAFHASAKPETAIPKKQPEDWRRRGFTISLVSCRPIALQSAECLRLRIWAGGIDSPETKYQS